MTAFIVLALLLLGFTATLLIVPLMRPSAPPRDTENIRRDTTLAILRGQIAEMEQERAAGTLSADEFEIASEDLKRRILEETRTDESAAPPMFSARPSLVLPIVALLFVCATSTLGYLVLGAPAALSASTHAANAGTAEPRIEAIVEQLAKRLQEDPTDEAGWIMLGRSYQTLNRHAEAAEAYARAEERIARDPELLVNYAETLSSVQSTLSGKPLTLIEKALQLDPEHGQALFLAGVAAYERGDKGKAADYWEKLLPRAQEADPQTYEQLKQKIAELRAEAVAEASKQKPGKKAPKK